MQFFGIDIYHGSYREFFELIKHPGAKTLVFTPNPEILLRASRDQDFLAILEQATYNTPDANGLYTATLMQEGSGFFGAGLHTFFAKQSLKKKYGELIKGSDLTRDLFHFAMKHHKHILMIDSYRITTPKNAFEIQKMRIQSEFLDRLHQAYPGLHITLIFDGEKSPKEIAEIIEDKDIRYVFACTGMKKQEQLLLEIWAHLPDSTRVVGLGVGASVDFLLGLQHRAPKIVQSLGFEWLYRLALSPRKRWGRIMDAVYYFPQSVKNSTK